METVVILTANAARAITEDIIHNKVGEMIPIVAERIDIAARYGLGSVSVEFPRNWVNEQKQALAQFFVQLGYKTSYTSISIFVAWKN